MAKLPAGIVEWLPRGTAEEIWTRAGSIWLQSRDPEGPFTATLSPGKIFEARRYKLNQGPYTKDPLLLDTIIVPYIKKRPAERQLIRDQSDEFGGTWYEHGIRTVGSTRLGLAAAQLTPIALDSTGLPVLKDAVRPNNATGEQEVFHKPEITVLPGQHYYYAALVYDDFGNWEVVQRSFTTLRRRFTVNFTRIRVYNDGDPAGHGNAMFVFRVHYRGSQGIRRLATFTMPFMDIDDWGETDRPYPMGFTHIEPLRIVSADESDVCVYSEGLEEDGIFEMDEIATSDYISLPFPTGRAENVLDQRFSHAKCHYRNDDFFYGIDVAWTVAYEP